MPQVVFESDTELTAVAIGYHNDKANYIADKILPFVTVGEPNFKYNRYPVNEGYSVPDTRVGRKSPPNKIELSSSSVTESVEDYGLDAVVPSYDVERAPKNYNPKARAVETVTDLLQLDREIRAAAIARDLKNYALKETLATGSYFDDPDSDPIRIILDAYDKMLVSPNTLLLGMDVWTKFRMHPKVIKATHGNSGDCGVASREAVKELLELQDLQIGNSKYNISKKGQSPTITPCWQGVCSLLHVNPNADTNNGVTWGFTARFGNKVASTFFDRDIGLRGGEVIRVGETLKELICAPDCSYAFSNVLNPSK